MKRQLWTKGKKMQNRVIIIDDDPELCALLEKCVTCDGFAADCARNGREGLEKLKESGAVLVVLDVMMPGMDGFEVLKKIRETSTVPVLMLTARGENIDKVYGLRLGADDYLTKPFDINEFSARVHSLVRRYTVLNGNGEQSGQRLSFKGLEIDPDKRKVTVRGAEVTLQAKAFDILYYLAKNKGRALTKKQIYEEVWQEEYLYDDSNIMAHISKIRRLIEPDVKRPAYIQTIKGVGYRFNAEV
ncbi:response regulator transcription factor [Eubacterium sp. 1001713B170207_170306_E7]|uniref:response regulator transcription factor n=1 Tax=Eubacterium sp. 1001713B170207_170306_E7 TaxID=2787097 RepID=UPI001FAD72C1|nr:response regulator transcription factor [Eubacterium sp. 1001713B170207_170306_E7]